MFEGFHYTISITLSGLLLFPYAVGPVGNFGMLLVVVAFCLLEGVFSLKTGERLDDKLFREHERYALITQKQVNEWQTSLSSSANAAEEHDKQTARSVFDKLLEPNETAVRASDIYKLVQQLALPSMTTQKIMSLADANQDGSISFDEFYRYIWTIGSVHTRIQKSADNKRGPVALSARDKARVVFEMLDIDDSGYISLAELELLLTQWGIPYNESKLCLDKYAGTDHKVDFDEFHAKLKPVWDFAATFVY